MTKKVKILGMVLDGFTYFSAILTALALFMIMGFVFRNGFSLLSFDLLTKDYHANHYVATLNEDESITFTNPGMDEGYFVERYGIVINDTKNLSGDTIIEVIYVEEYSPFNALNNQNDQIIALEEGMLLSRVTYEEHPTSLTNRGAYSMAEDLNNEDRVIREVMFSTVGGGIRGSLIATLYLIGLTLMIAMPFGILSAVYLNEFAPNNKLTRTIRSFIETLTGVPSIIFGLLGITVFVPITSSLTQANGSNLIAGALTLSVILLPVIIRTTEEALRVVPNEHRFASLALGANHTQTTFKVVLPQALSGILTATFLAIGRIIGESAALIFVLGTAIKDRVSVFESATPLAVHIWSMMTDEPANIALSSTVAIIILSIVLILNIGIKLSVFFWNRKRSVS